MFNYPSYHTPYFGPGQVLIPVKSQLGLGIPKPKPPLVEPMWGPPTCPNTPIPKQPSTPTVATIPVPGSGSNNTTNFPSHPIPGTILIPSSP
ncbi:hypothetical protein JOC83_002268 [Bacillus iocasae]|uniref:Uncharacterized protein n=1 Tax=Priestia iocasae TaxID=2291674 RepID=A0ABS2QVA1_9BACI|nr:hypothetical protein [Metabacillus iocasae]